MSMPYRLQSPGMFTALAALACFASAAAAQDDKRYEKVRIKTVDGVDLAGQFYPGKGETPPVVMLLHGFKENIRSKEWTALARELQEKRGYAVLAFDFRGFGSGTTEVDPMLFWAPTNRLNLMLKAGRESISSKEFPRDGRYYPALINDIAAAKAFLDRRNDGNAGGARCNSSNLILIGSKEGAALGAAWLNAEWHRYKIKLNDFGQPIITFNAFGQQAVADTKQSPAGSGVIAAIWLSITPKLGTFTSVGLDSALLLPAKKQFTPMVFMYGADDKASGKIARHLESKFVVYKKLKKANGERAIDEKYKFTLHYPVKNTKLEGAGLLQEGLGTAQKIGEYLEAVVAAKSNEWVEQDFRKTGYVRVSELPASPLLPAYGKLIKRLTDTYLEYSDYARYLR